MLIRILLWSMLAGSAVMGYLGYKTGSATNAAIGMGIILIGGFLLFFILKMFLHFGFFIIKILLLLALIALIAVSGLKGCQYLMNNGRKVNQQQVEKVQSFETEMAGKPLWEKALSFFSFSNNDKPSFSRPTPKRVQKTPVRKDPLPERISGSVTDVRSGYLFRLNNHFIKLYGIDAPDPSQSCLDKRGNNYACGHQAKSMLEKLILGKPLECQITGGDYKGNYIATCKMRDVDIGATMLTAGWAVADRVATSVYTPYEEVAHRKKQGLWAGYFVAPWEARKKHAQSSPSQKSDEGFWEGLLK